MRREAAENAAGPACGIDGVRGNHGDGRGARFPEGWILTEYCYEATVGNDNAIRLDGMIIDVPPGPGGRGYAGVRAEVRQMLDGSWRVYHQDKLIAQVPPTEIAELIRTRRRRKGARAANDAAWVFLASAPNREISGKAAAKTAGGTVRRAGPGGTIGASRIA